MSEFDADCGLDEGVKHASITAASAKNNIRAILVSTRPLGECNHDLPVKSQQIIANVFISRLNLGGVKVLPRSASVNPNKSDTVRNILRLPNPPLEIMPELRPPRMVIFERCAQNLLLIFQALCWKEAGFMSLRTTHTSVQKCTHFALRLEDNETTVIVFDEETVMPEDQPSVKAV